VNGIKLAAEDEVIGAAVIPEDANGCGLLTVTENGYGKRTDFGRYRTQSRYGKGVIDIKTGDRNGQVAQATTVCETDDILIMTTNGQIMRVNAQDISEVGRNTKGVRLMKLADGDSVQSISTVPNDD
jgi:DNA gyrase subunit A